MKKHLILEIDQLLISNKSRFILIIGQIESILKYQKNMIKEGKTKNIIGSIKKLNQSKHNIRKLTKDIIENIEHLKTILRIYKMKF